MGEQVAPLNGNDRGPEEKRYAKSQLAKINRWIKAANKAVNDAKR
jgi:hypothetical protein